MVAEVRFERTSLAYETKLEPSPVYSAIKRQNLLPADGIEPSPDRLSTDCSPGELCRNGAGCRNRTDLSGLQNRRIAADAYPADTLGASAGNRTRAGRLPCGNSATEIHRLEPKRGFELRSGRYERPVLPIELLRLERARRIELRWLDWQSSAQPMSHTRQIIGADGDNRNLFSGLEAQGTSYIPRPPVTHANCQRTGRGPRI
jgi:hypothetical protein